MASVRLDFVPPNSPDITKLKIWESPSRTGVFNVIETINGVGAYPDYISYYTTQNASSPSNWFAISWEDSRGAQTELSTPIQGGTTTLVQQIISRVMLRDPLADENIAVQEAEAVIEDVFPGVDPYLIDVSTVTAKQKSGITFLTLARTYLSSIVTSISAGSGESYTAGLVSQGTSNQSQSQVSQGLTNIKQLIDWANADLGLNYSIVMLMAEIDVAGQLWGFNEFTFEALAQ